MERKEKKVVSRVLQEERNWISIKDKLPKIGEHVVIRFVNNSILYGETEEEIYPAEDIKIGQLVRDINNPSKGRFIIDPPFPKYDYSPLTNKEMLGVGTEVTHWAVPFEGELENWAHRLDFNRSYHHLKLEVDPENEEVVYRALLHGSSFIANAGGEEFAKCKPGEGMKMLYEILCDLQTCIDKGVSIDDGKYYELPGLENSSLISLPDEDEESDIITAEKVLRDFAMVKSNLDVLPDDLKFDKEFLDAISNKITDMNAIILSYLAECKKRDFNVVKKKENGDAVDNR